MSAELSAEQLRELDAWIAEHVFGYRWFAFEGGKSNCFCDLQLPSDWQSRHGGVMCDAPLAGYERDIGGVAKYTTDPAAALAVLEKCAEADVITILTSDVSEGRFVLTSRVRRNRGSANTLALAICLLARQLFPQ